DGVKRMLFISTIGVHGRSSREQSISEASAVCPQSEYAGSKWRAEVALRKVSLETGLDVVVLRPPLVYGPDAPGNIATLVSAIGKGVPLPVGSIKNQRSLLFVGNLVEGILACLETPGAAGESFVIADNDVVSTPELVRWLSLALGRKPRMFACPPAI